jgi:enoyl-CoA hydratase/carnithine racemase
MESRRYDTLRVAFAGGIARVTLAHPPINLLDAALFDDLDRLAVALEADDEVRVVIVDSADAAFFIAHADVAGMLGRGDAQAERRERLSRFAELTERLRALPAVTIAVVEGRVRGGGSELILALDLRFAALETAIFAQPEVGLGLIPGGGATQRLPPLVGRSRALEIMLGAGDHDAAGAERYGWVTRALPAAELRPYVDELATRIAGFSRSAVASVKAAVDLADDGPYDGLREEHRLFRRVLASEQATTTLERFLRAGGQTRAYELLVGAWSLVSYEVQDPDGSVRLPLGATPVGSLVYGLDGSLSARLATGPEVADAIAYRGTFALDEAAASVLHHVTAGLEPAWVGHTLRRAFELTGDTLVLRASPREPDGSRGAHVLTWCRTPAG